MKLVVSTCCIKYPLNQVYIYKHTHIYIYIYIYIYIIHIYIYIHYIHIYIYIYIYYIPAMKMLLTPTVLSFDDRSLTSKKDSQGHIKNINNNTKMS